MKYRYISEARLQNFPHVVFFFAASRGKSFFYFNYCDDVSEICIEISLHAEVLPHHNKENYTRWWMCVLLKLSSNHNPPRPDKSLHGVVSYPKSSSNHNLCRIKACLSLCYVMHLANRKWNEDVPFSANVLKKLQLYGFLLDFLLYLTPNIYDIGVLLVCNG